MIGYAPFLGQVRLVPYAGFRLGQALKCWKTDDGGTVCSNLMYYSPNCPTTPPLTETEILPTPPEAPGASWGNPVSVSPSAIPGGGPAPEPQDIIARVEVRDAESEVYIPAADVSVIFPGGKASKRTDIGGNASFSRNDFAGVSSETLRSAVYRVEKPGYEPQEKTFVEGQIVLFVLSRAKAVVAPGTIAAPSEFPTTTVLAVGGVAAAGLIAFLALR